MTSWSRPQCTHGYKCEGRGAGWGAVQTRILAPRCARYRPQTLLSLIRASPPTCFSPSTQAEGNSMSSKGLQRSLVICRVVAAS